MHSSDENIDSPHLRSEPEDSPRLTEGIQKWRMRKERILESSNKDARCQFVPSLGLQVPAEIIVYLEVRVVDSILRRGFSEAWDTPKTKNVWTNEQGQGEVSFYTV